MEWRNMKNFLRKILNGNKYNKLKKMGIKIGENCEIYDNISWGSEPYMISIGNHVRISNGVRFITHDGGVWVLRNMEDRYKNIDLFGAITVGDNVHIGMDVTIMPNVNIGKNCIIGCGAIVTKDIPDNSVAVGVPARVIEDVQTYVDKNKCKFVNTKNMSSVEKQKYIEQNILNKYKS